MAPHWGPLTPHDSPGTPQDQQEELDRIKREELEKKDNAAQAAKDYHGLYYPVFWSGYPFDLVIARIQKWGLHR